jgi:hypothetical protein
MFPLKNKLDVFSTFVNFKCLIENLLVSTCITILYPCWLNMEFFRVSCPHTSQQNGISERKDRHLVETGLCLLAQPYSFSILFQQ